MLVHQIYYARGNAHCFALPLVPGFCRAEDQHSGLTVNQSADCLCRDIPHFCHLENRVMPLGGNCAAHGLRGLRFQRMHGFPCRFTRIHQFVYLCSRSSVPLSFMLVRNKDRGFDCLARPKASGCPAGQFARAERGTKAWHSHSFPAVMCVTKPLCNVINGGNDNARPRAAIEA